jgi:septum formation protein
MLTTLKPIILASNSQIRKEMLTEAGINFTIIKATCDEEALKQEFCQSMSAGDESLFLAAKKAESISLAYPDSYVIGADNICELEGEFLSKPGEIEKAKEHLKKLSGKTHFQNCAVSVYLAGTEVFSCYKQTKLTMRCLEEQEINSYVETYKPIFACGAYMFEGVGKYLFSRIDGSYDVIMGLPMIPLINFLLSEQTLKFC